MLNQLNRQQFCYWLDSMEITYEEAAELLKTSVSTIEGYALGAFKVSSLHTSECHLLLRLKSNKKKEAALGR